jgi:hypothetical protein
MVDQPAAQTAGPNHCPWCSAELPPEAVENCPSCGATLVGESEAALPGVTAIDAEAIVRNARMPTAQRRSRILSWFGGEDTTPDEAPAPPGSLAPPPPDVRREILRLELEADIANLQAEADSIVADAALEAGEEGVAAVNGETPAEGADVDQAAEDADLAVAQPLEDSAEAAASTEPEASEPADASATTDEHPEGTTTSA